MVLKWRTLGFVLLVKHETLMLLKQPYCRVRHGSGAELSAHGSTFFRSCRAFDNETKCSSSQDVLFRLYSLHKLGHGRCEIKMTIIPRIDRNFLKPRVRQGPNKFADFSALFQSSFCFNNALVTLVLRYSIPMTNASD